MRSFFLTFDVEDFISENSVPGLHNILELLKKHELTALFFITGAMAQKLSNFPATLDLLREQQIGYHSSGHSVHPTIFEFTDVESYQEAYQTSFIRETARINPLTGEIEGVGGIRALQDLFPQKKIVSFRAPGYCWTPPHLEAMKTLGLIYDFSTNIFPEPIEYRGITFYPFTALVEWRGGLREQSRLQQIILRHKTTVLTIHPSTIVNKLDWDLIYYPRNGNPKLNPERLTQPPPRSPAEVLSKCHKFEMLLRHLITLQRLHFLEVNPELKISSKTLCRSSLDITACYRMSMKWAEGFQYKPRFIYNHFKQFFGPDY